MYLKQLAATLAFVALLFAGALACRTTNVLIGEATVTPSRTPRPTRTPIPTSTDTPVPTDTPTPEPTATATRRPTVHPTARPPTATPAPVVVAPTTSPFEFHVNPPLPCQHSGLTYLKGTVYLDKNDPTNIYVGAIVALGAPDGSTIYDKQKTDDLGQYAFILSEPGHGTTGNYGLWLITPSEVRKSDIGGPINTNDLPADDPASCWASGVDFWK